MAFVISVTSGVEIVFHSMYTQHTLRSVTVTVTVARLMKLDLLVRRSGRERGGDDEVETRYEDEMETRYLSSMSFNEPVE